MKGKKDLTNWWLAIAIVLFFADVAMRRFQYVPNWKIGTNKSGEAIHEIEPEILAKAEEISIEHKNQQEVEPSEAKKETAKKKVSKKQMKPSEQTLDTSQLLKKKDDRNI